MTSVTVFQEISLLLMVCNGVCLVGFAVAAHRLSGVRRAVEDLRLDILSLYEV